jgi:hypothetical protein
MSVAKGEIRAALLTTVGAQIETLFESSTAAVARADGSETALKQAHDVICQMHAEIDRLVEDGTISELDQAQTIKNWITRAATVCSRMASQHALTRSIQSGHAQGLNAAVQLLSRLHKSELATIEEHRRREEAQVPELDDNASIKQQRLAEALAELDGAPPQAPAAPLAAPERSSAAPVAGGSIKPRRRRRAGTDAADA